MGISLNKEESRRKAGYENIIVKKQNAVCELKRRIDSDRIQSSELDQVEIFTQEAS